MIFAILFADFAVYNAWMPKGLMYNNFKERIRAMKNLMKMDDVLTDEMALVFGGINDVPVIHCNSNGIVNIPTKPTEDNKEDLF